MKGPYIAGLDVKLKQLEDDLGSNDWFVSNKISIADFGVYTALAIHLELCSDVVKKFPKLVAFKKRVDGLEKLQKFFASELNFKPLCGPGAQFMPMPAN